MGLFNFFKKKETGCGCGCGCGSTENVAQVKKVEEEKVSCCCGGDDAVAPVEEEKVYNEDGEEMAMCDCGNMCKVSDIEAKKAAEKISSEKGMFVKVLGPGCKKCNELEAATIEALKQLNMEPSVEHVTDFAEIAAYGVMTTPALVIDGKVVSMGKVLKTNEVVALLTKSKG